MWILDQTESELKISREEHFKHPTKSPEEMSRHVNML